MSSGTDNQSELNNRPYTARDDQVSASKPGTPEGGRRESILVHACCASCSSYVLAHLGERYGVTAYYYNPNIQPEDEYRLRLGEMRMVCEGLQVPLLEGPYDTDGWWRGIEPYRELPERSERCWTCYGLRLEETARKAKELGFGLFTTTLSVSPHKVHRCIVSEGKEAASRHNVRFLDEDFKKKDGFKISVEQSRELHLTRQDYCGCLLSLEEAKRRR